MEEEGTVTDDGTTSGAEQLNEETQVTEPEESGLEGEENPDTGKVYTQAEIDELLDNKSAEVKKATERKLRRQFEREQSQKAEPVQDDLKKPVSDDYKTADEFITAKVHYEMAVAEQARAAKQAELSNEAYQDEVKEKLGDHLDAAEDLPGFDRVKFQAMAGEVRYAKAFEEALADVSNAPKVLEYLYMNPKEFYGLEELSPLGQVIRLGEISTHLKSKKRASGDQAPRVGGGIAPTGDLMSIPIDKYTAQRAKEGSVWAVRAMAERSRQT
jgi:hypothetical protein